jgi:hypothetical protein
MLGEEDDGFDEGGMVATVNSEELLCCPSSCSFSALGIVMFLWCCEVR